MNDLAGGSNRINNARRVLWNHKIFQVEVRIYVCFILIVILGYWPVSTGLFGLKNDDIIYFLPYRYNIVENIRFGHFPLWSPYIYMGFPVCNDMQSGAWNPVVWLLSLTGRYTLVTLHFEFLLYLFIGALGMYKLMAELEFTKIVCLTVGVSYIFGGFVIDSGQILCWIASACFLPYTYLYFIRIMKAPALTSSVKFTVSNFLLIVAGYPFFFIANLYLFSIAFIVFFILSITRRQVKNSKPVFGHLCLSAVLLLLLGAAPFMSFHDLLPYYERGQHLALEDALDNSYSLLSFISLIFPFSVTRVHASFHNNGDIARNLYVGILLLPFITKGILSKKTAWWNTVLVLAILALLLSLALVFPLRRWAYFYLPLMNTFRHPANFRIFAIIALLSFAAKGLQEFLSVSDKYEVKKVTRLFYALAILMLFVLFCFLPLKEHLAVNDLSLSPAGLKKLLTQLSFQHAVLVSFILQIPFVVSAAYLVKKKKFKALCYLSIANIVVIGQLHVFTSTVGKNPVGEINKFIVKQPSGFPIPDLSSAVSMPDENKIFFYEYKLTNAYFYNKKIAINTYINNPTILSSYSSFVNDSLLAMTIKDYPFAYISDSFATASKSHSDDRNQKEVFWLKSSVVRNNFYQHNQLQMLSFGPNEFKISVKSDAGCNVVILQNFYPGWKASIDATPSPIQTVNKTFMGLVVPAGEHTVRFSYSPSWFLPGIILSVLGFIGCLFLLAIKPGSLLLQKRIGP